MSTAPSLEYARRRGSGRVPSQEQAVDSSTITTLTLNIGAAALSRAAKISRWLRKRSDDLIVLTETSSGLGTRLLHSELESVGYSTYATADSHDRGVLVASRVAVCESLSDRLSVTLPWRATGIVLGTAPQVALVGVYVPSRDRSAAKVARKEAFMSSLLESVRALPETLRRRLVLVGDYNAVARRHDPPLAGFFPYEYGFHEELERIGLSAAHELRPRGGHPHSWIGRTGTGYLYDYIHVGADLQRRVQRCEYLHSPRTRRLSDHAAVAVQIVLD